MLTQARPSTDKTAEVFNFNNHAYRRFVETLKASGILSH